MVSGSRGNIVVGTATGAVRTVVANGIDINAAVAGEGPAVLLLHGFPHTWEVWSRVIPDLARSHRVIAPDLRGLGGTSRAVGGYDVAALAADAVGLLDALDVATADVVGIDLGTPPALVLALEHPERLRRLVVMESLVGGLPGAEDFLRGGPPWWFGFHSVPDLPQKVLLGHEAEYIGWFLDAGTFHGRGLAPAVREAFVRAYTGEESLRCAFDHYRAFPANAERFRAVLRTTRLKTPTMTIGSQPVGSALYQQLAPVADDLRGHVIPDCGHIIPLDAPEALLAVLTPFLS